MAVRRAEIGASGLRRLGNVAVTKFGPAAMPKKIPKLLCRNGLSVPGRSAGDHLPSITLSGIC